VTKGFPARQVELRDAFDGSTFFLGNSGFGSIFSGELGEFFRREQKTCRFHKRSINTMHFDFFCSQIIRCGSGPTEDLKQQNGELRRWTRTGTNLCSISPEL
jgi:hypothetical protein